MHGSKDLCAITVVTLFNVINLSVLGSDRVSDTLSSILSHVGRINPGKEVEGTTKG
ncbi:uncharacterized protein G2W53_030028 [Senna tora]|uniref:Uncharacterized protein n=1 Tax=Senna tora TaxID=362788 RepID=A0A834TF44_9FABA|nr:uncharacterized protein G2W53_030028 [Senna tora]